MTWTRRAKDDEDQDENVLIVTSLAITIARSDWLELTKRSNFLHWDSGRKKRDESKSRNEKEGKKHESSANQSDIGTS